eukprot:TRINITY_DN7324_c0_g1_i23.p1 TRINITY_DN7324_c0_g1~~TRINITY_DN7324_c0_g1_i23.p1  ORF type:complete len:358 (-),score=99.27 TRINITY_DN7324_c0_g1_i23:301-1347(-)
MIRRPPRSTRKESSAASDVYKRQSIYNSKMRKEKPTGKSDKPKARIERPMGKLEKPAVKPDPKELNNVKHSFVAAGTTFTVPKRYEYIKVIGQGAYGVVCSAMDKLKGRKVAIKKVPNAFADLIDAKRIVREIKLLNFYNHENIVALLDVLKPESRTGFEDIYFVNDLMETDLHRVIYSQQDLTDDHIQYFMYQILRGVLHIHSSSVIHRDLKPSNLLLNKNCDLKICDFGLARALETGGVDNLLTEYVVTRWYRAPEVILNASNYTKELDIWSVGCIMAELLGRTPLFPGNVACECRTRLFGPDPENHRHPRLTLHRRHGLHRERSGSEVHKESAKAKQAVVVKSIR